MEKDVHYPFVPKTNSQLRPGQFFPIALSDGRFSCGRVLAIERNAGCGARTNFVLGLLDWVDESLPTTDSIANAGVYEVATAHAKTVQECGGEILGLRPLELDDISPPSEVRSFAGGMWAKERSERRFVAGEPPPAFELREVTSPVTDEMLRPLTSPQGKLQFKSRLTETEFKRLAEWCEAHPHVHLRAYGSYDGTITDLEFLRFFPMVRSFSADALYHSLASLDGLRHLHPELESLGIGDTKKKLDLSILGRFTGLKSLYIEAQKKNLDVISGLTSLEELTLRSITLPDLSLLLPLKGLLALDLKLGGTKDLALLPKVGDLKYLELWMIKGLTDLRPVGELSSLRYLFLQALRQVERLPDMRRMNDLRRVHIETMKGLTDLSPVASAPELRDLVLVDMPHLDVDSIDCFVGHPTLQTAVLGFGSVRKSVAAEERLGLPSPEGFKINWRDV